MAERIVIVISVNRLNNDSKSHKTVLADGGGCSAEVSCLSNEGWDFDCRGWAFLQSIKRVKSIDLETVKSTDGSP